MCCCSGAPKVGRGLRASRPRMTQAFKNLTIRAGPRPTRSAGQSRKRPCAVLGAALLAMLAGTPSFASGPATNAVDRAQVGNYVEWDVTALAGTWVSLTAPNQGISLSSSGSGTATFASQEGYYAPPQLFIAYEMAGDAGENPRSGGTPGPTGPTGPAGPRGATAPAGPTGTSPRPPPPGPARSPPAPRAAGPPGPPRRTRAPPRGPSPGHPRASR